MLGRADRGQLRQALVLRARGRLEEEVQVNAAVQLLQKRGTSWGGVWGRGGGLGRQGSLKSIEHHGWVVGEGGGWGDRKGGGTGGGAGGGGGRGDRLGKGEREEAEALNKALFKQRSAPSCSRLLLDSFERKMMQADLKKHTGFQSWGEGGWGEGRGLGGGGK